ncbi:MAG TPA: DNA internalization-related competence protein ComEC/Rec2 [Novimethylophilus sp.]|jgi:competence protein ComEC|uniref:DNA internalization-related competence protein ComEC/Rec2 n=1 Tax=Novimethylophilus sp. TaxID=2137426 RepID=UPI002F417E3A
MRSILLAFVGGAWLLQQQPALPNVLWGLPLLPCCAAAYFLPRRVVLSRSLLIFCALAAGFLWAAALARYRLADELPSAWEGRDIELVGVVAELPRPQQRGERFLFDVEQVLTPQAHVPARISLAYYAAGFREKSPGNFIGKFHPGERWRLTARLKHPHGSYNPSGFDFEAWALERNIRATGYLRKSTTTQRLRGMVYRPSYVVERTREGVRDHFRDVLGGQPYEGVLRALAIGDESGITRADWQVFLRTGVNHLMSISGLHVTMVSGLFFALTYGLWRRVPLLTLRLPARKAAALVGVLAALVYALLAGFAVPTQRTVYMLAVVAAALWWGRDIPISLVLGWALFVTVLLDPWAVLAPGFWLSFGAVAAMVYAGSGRLARAHWLRAAAHAQWAVTLGLIPLLLALFQQVSIVSPLANAFAIPIVSLVVVPLALLGAIVPVDAILLAAHQVMVWCMDLLQWMSALPDAVWQQHAPPPWTVPLALLGVMWLLLPRGFPARWLGLPACLPMFLLLPPLPAPGELKVAVLDVGQGLAVVAQTAHHALLYDAGPRFSDDADSGSWVIVPFLRGAGIGRLDGLIVSHDDLDHSGGAQSVLDAVPVGWFASSLPPGHELLDEAPGPRPCFAGQTWQWDGVRFEMLHPGWGSYGNAGLKDNFRSCVLKVTSAYGSLLLPADIERDAEAELLAQQPSALAADVLVAPHHGSKTSSSADFLHQVHPSIAIFTMGYRNRFGHPKPEVVERYRDLGGRLYRSDADGMVQLDFAADGIAVRSWRRARPRYWLAESEDAR